MENVNVIPVGRERNAVFGMMNVKYLTAMGMDTVITENVTALGVIKANSAKRVRFPKSPTSSPITIFNFFSRLSTSDLFRSWFLCRRNLSL